MTVNVEMAISSQHWSLSSDITFTMEENYFVERIHNQIQHHLTKTMDDSLFQGMIGLSLGTLDIQGFAQVLLNMFFLAAKAQLNTCTCPQSVCLSVCLSQT